MLPQIEECRINPCTHCGRFGNGEQQTLLSLDGNLSGDIPPSAAVGLGFLSLGGRPVANANIVENLGLRDPATGLLQSQKAKVAATVASSSESAQIPGEGTEISFLHMFDSDTWSMDTPLGQLPKRRYG